jgi:hypothetical protein
MLIEASVHAGFLDTITKIAGEKKVITAFYTIYAERTDGVFCLPKYINNNNN